MFIPFRIFLSALFIIAIVQAFFSPIALADKMLDVVGHAYHRENNQLLYIENHYRNSSDGIVTHVEYLDATGNTIAFKYLKATHPPTPELLQIDLRDGEFRAAGRNSKDSIELLYRQTNKSTTKNGHIDLNENLVIDAGFDAYIRHHWRRLVKDKKVLKIDFVVPSRQSTIQMTVKHINCHVPDRSCFVVHPSNLIIRLLAGFFELEYSDVNKQLMTFRGLSNINNSKGKGQKVVIHYNYQVDTNINESDKFIGSTTSTTRFLDIP